MTSRPFCAPSWINGAMSSRRRTSERSKAGGLADVRTRGHVRADVDCSLTRRSEVRFQGQTGKSSRPGVPNELLQTRDHFDDGPQFVPSPIDHLDGDVE